MTLRHLVVLWCFFCVLPQHTQAAWYVERVYSDPSCISLEIAHMYEVGRCSYNGNGGYMVYLRAMDALIVHSCFDSDCKNCSIGTDAELSAACTRHGDRAHTLSLVSDFPDTTNITITVSFRDYNCIGPIGKLTLSPGCSVNPLLYQTCMGYTHSFCETPFLPASANSLLPLFPTPLTHSHPNSLLPRGSSPLSSRPSRDGVQPTWYFKQYYNESKGVALQQAYGYRLWQCVNELQSAFYFTIPDNYPESSYVLKFSCLDSACNECAATPTENYTTNAPIRGMSTFEYEINQIYSGYPRNFTNGTATVWSSIPGCDFVLALRSVKYDPTPCKSSNASLCTQTTDGSYTTYCGPPPLFPIGDTFSPSSSSTGSTQFTTALTRNSSTTGATQNSSTTGAAQNSSTTGAAQNSSTTGVIQSSSTTGVTQSSSTTASTASTALTAATTLIPPVFPTTTANITSTSVITTAATAATTTTPATTTPATTTPATATTTTTSSGGLPTPIPGAKWVFQETRRNCSNPNSVVSAVAWMVGQCRPDGSGGAAMILMADMNSVVLFNCLWANCTYCPVSTILKLNVCERLVGDQYSTTTLYSGFPNYLAYGAVEVIYNNDTTCSSSFDRVSVLPVCTETNTNTNVTMCKHIPFTSTYYTDFCGLPSFINLAPSPTSPPTNNPTPTLAPTRAPTPTPAPTPVYPTYDKWILRSVHMDGNCSEPLFREAVGVAVGVCTPDETNQTLFHRFALSELYSLDGNIYHIFCTDSKCRYCYSYDTIQNATCNSIPGDSYQQYRVVSLLPSKLREYTQAYVQYHSSACTSPFKFKILPECDGVTKCKLSASGNGSEESTCTIPPYFPYPAPSPTTTRNPTTVAASTSTSARTTSTPTVTPISTTAAATGYYTTSYPSSTTAQLCPCPPPSGGSRASSFSLFLLFFMCIFVCLFVT